MLVLAVISWSLPRTADVPWDPTATADRPFSGPPRESDAALCALEYALRVAEGRGGRCVAITVGPPETDDILRRALAVGARHVLRIAAPHPEHIAAEDGDAAARVVLDVVTERYGVPDLVVCGDDADEGGAGAMPAYLAARMGAAQALGLVDLRVAQEGLRAVRRLDGGRREVLEVPFPAVCSVEAGGPRLRRAPLPAVLSAQRASIPARATAATAAPNQRVHVHAEQPYRPRPRAIEAPEADAALDRIRALTGGSQRQVVRRLVTPGDPVEAVDVLLEYLNDHEYLSGLADVDRSAS